jgi:hypothetical protein
MTLLPRKNGHEVHPEIRAFRNLLRFVRPTDGENLISSLSINLHEAALCAEDHVFALRDGRSTCPCCGTSSWVRLSSLGLDGLRPLSFGEKDEEI